MRSNITYFLSLSYNQAFSLSYTVGFSPSEHMRSNFPQTPKSVQTVAKSQLLSPSLAGNCSYYGFRRLLISQELQYVPKANSRSRSNFHSQLMHIGLLYTPVSIYQMTRGSLVLFVGFLSVVFLRRRLWLYQLGLSSMLYHLLSHHVA